MKENVAECVGWERVCDVVGQDAVRDSVRENERDAVLAGVTDIEAVTEWLMLSVADRVDGGVTVTVRLLVDERENVADRVAAEIDAVVLKVPLRVCAGVTVAETDAD